MTDWRSWLQSFSDVLKGAALGRHEHLMRQYSSELNDLFLLLCHMELMGLPNPATLYLLDVYPLLLEEFHLWHRRMGMPRSPIGNLPCC